MDAAVIRRSPVQTAAVTATAELTPRMRRVTLTAPSLAGRPIRPAQDVELLLREASGRRVKRRYTVRRSRPDSGEIDLDVLLHGAGPGSEWARTARVGDAVEFQGPRGKLELRPAPWHLLVGDESALPAIAAIAEALPAGEHALAYVEVRDGQDELPIPAAEVHWVHRGDAAAGTPDHLAAAVTGALPAAATGALADRPIPAEARGYLLGESRAMIALRGVLEAGGIAHDAIFVKGYWNVGRPDRLAGRAPA